MNGENKELKDEIIQLGMRYGIVTPYTSFLVTEDMKVVGSRTLPMERRRALESLRQMSPATSGTGSTAWWQANASGESAVVYSKVEKEMKESVSLANPESYLSSVRTVGDKTFQLKDDVWTDTEVKDSSSLPKVEVQFGSEDFFNLIAKEPKLAELFSLGKKVTVLYKGKIYRVTG